ncbi:predicted protein [Histoplasma mississippiense (nom. inval.)]|uniref:predicted protein n=1 Tax=Ajellomyces capsulatus (strain NAm1 / WU24) TaxID=2059318 RepID=UPI000157D354|nr:predicted protein [Histoplasma mississippiense (nom. inval.)]EDN04661.1 predicted protein [Histoplasma mississippiense (nom. inval.)]
MTGTKIVTKEKKSRPSCRISYKKVTAIKVGIIAEAILSMNYRATIRELHTAASSIRI